MFARMVIRFVKPVSLFLFSLLAACGPEVQPPARTVADPVVASPSEANDLPQAPVVDEVTEEKIIVAILLPLSGSEATVGKALLRAATMALFDAYDPRLVLVPIDTKANPVEAKKAAHEAIERGASIVLGPLLSNNVRIAGEILAEANIPLIGFSNDSTVAAPGRFIMGFLPETEVKRVVDYAVSLGLHNQAALVPYGRYGARVREAFGDAVSAAGAHVAAIENYPPDPNAVFNPVKRLANYDVRRKARRDEVRFLKSLGDDVTDELAEELEKTEVLDELGYDAVLLPEGGELLKTLAPLLPFYEIDPNKIKLLGTGLWNDPTLLGEPPLQGALFAAPDPKAPNAFLARFEETFGTKAPRIATLAYDAMSLVALLARTEPIVDVNCVQVSRFSVDALRTDTGFTGLDGLFRFLPDGTAERSLAILEVHRRGFKVMDAAPVAFPSFGYALRQPVSQ